jgi:hypothetical protein
MAGFGSLFRISAMRRAARAEIDTGLAAFMVVLAC